MTSNRDQLWSALLVCGIVIAAFAILPHLAAISSASFMMCIVAMARGIALAGSGDYSKYYMNVGQFFGELTLLIGIGVFAIVVWSNRTDIRIFGYGSRWKEILFGCGAGFANWIFFEWMGPLLWLAAPLGSTGNGKVYHQISNYSTSFTNRMAELFFVDCFYSPIAETLIFVGFLYYKLRLKFSVVTAVLLSSLVIALAHRNQVFFFNYFAFGLLNCCLYEFRKSLAPSLFQHIICNLLIYGSPLLSITKIGKL